MAKKQTTKKVAEQEVKATNEMVEVVIEKPTKPTTLKKLIKKPCL